MSALPDHGRHCVRTLANGNQVAATVLVVGDVDVLVVLIVYDVGGTKE